MHDAGPVRNTLPRMWNDDIVGWFVRGHWWTSLQTNAAGTLFAFLDAGLPLSFVYFGWTNKRPTDNCLKGLVTVLIVGMALALTIWTGRSV